VVGGAVGGAVGVLASFGVLGALASMPASLMVMGPASLVLPPASPAAVLPASLLGLMPGSTLVPASIEPSWPPSARPSAVGFPGSSLSSAEGLESSPQATTVSSAAQSHANTQFFTGDSFRCLSEAMRALWQRALSTRARQPQRDTPGRPKLRLSCPVRAGAANYLAFDTHVVGPRNDAQRPLPSRLGVPPLLPCETPLWSTTSRPAFCPCANTSRWRWPRWEIVRR
jgi:hypothetical protein